MCFSIRISTSLISLFAFAFIHSKSTADMPLAWSVGESELLESPIVNPQVELLPEPEAAEPIETIPADALALPAEAIEDPPLRQEVFRWYQYPTRWMRGWDSHAEIGLDGSDGNADTFAFQTGLELKRKTDRDKWFVDIDYRRVTSRGVTTEDNGRFNLDYDRLIGNSRWSAFGKFGLEFDSFKAFDSRLNLNGGAGYHWIKSDSTSLITRFGAGTSREFGGPNEDWVPEAVFGVEAERQLTARQKLKAKIDYFPAWTDFGNYRLVFDGSWEILLDGSENLSLKLAVTDRYDSTPEGALPNDIYYSLLLLYKF
ncbi:MAG: DUF481 domain-containing protein [Planctomycetota bacterium]